MKKRGGRILWLVYLDSTIPRSRGRIIAKSAAVPKPTIQEVEEALRRLGYSYESYPEKKYPPLWYEERARGYFLVKSDEKPASIAAKVAEEVRRIRGQ